MISINLPKLSKNNTTGHNGIEKRASGYRARIRVSGKFLDLGTFKRIEEAVEARAEAEILYGRVVRHPLYSPYNISGIKGVYWREKKNRWETRIKLPGGDRHVGYFDNKEAAITAREEAEAKYFPKGRT